MTNFRFLRMASFSFCDVRNKLPVINELFQHNDVLVLQDTCFLRLSTSLMDSIKSQLRSYSISAADINEPLVRRLYNGVSFLWKKYLENCLNLLTSEDSRIPAFTPSFDSRSILFLNVYLQYYSLDNMFEYLDCLWKVESLIDDLGSSEIVIKRDLNASIGSTFYSM